MQNPGRSGQVIPPHQDPHPKAEPDPAFRCPSLIANINIMWLVNTETLELESFFANIPPYAILSHTWEDGEVTFTDMASPDRIRKNGYQKILQTCCLARIYKLDYAWIDTCCIDKSSSAELSEAINSIFNYYRDAVVCYVYLSDLLPGSDASALSTCRWFTRGWTLQELIAPRRLELFDGTWHHFDSREGLASILSEITGVPPGILTGADDLAEGTLASRMSWAASRQTTRLEDTAYCLLGIFNVHMPLIYGEGAQAFRRLQEEISKRYNDLSLFAWESVEENLPEGEHFVGVFAPSPEPFTQSSKTIQSEFDSFPEFSVTNKGLQISEGAPLEILSISTRNGQQDVYSLHCGRNSYGPADIVLRKVGPHIYVRMAVFLLH